MATSMQTKAAHDALSARTTTALRVVVAVSLVAACVMALAQTGTDAPDGAAARASEYVELDLVDVERAFWACDRAATTRGVHGVAGVACGTVTEQLKQRKFNGDFAAMLAWWHDNKAAMHQAVMQAEEQAEQQAGNTAADADEIPMP